MGGRAAKKCELLADDLVYNGRHRPRPTPFHFSYNEGLILEFLSDVQLPRHDNKLLGARLGVSEAVAKTYVSWLMRKLKTDRIGLVLVGLQLRAGKFDAARYFGELEPLQGLDGRVVLRPIKLFL